MIKTIEISKYISVQGIQVSQNMDGRIVIHVNGINYTGYPVMSHISC